MNDYAACCDQLKEDELESMEDFFRYIQGQEFRNKMAWHIEKYARKNKGCSYGKAARKVLKEMKL